MWITFICLICLGIIHLQFNDFLIQNFLYEVILLILSQKSSSVCICTNHCIIDWRNIEQTPRIVNILDPSPTFVGPPETSLYSSACMYMYMNSPGWPGCRCLRFCWFCSASESWGGSWPCSCCCFFFFICSLASSETMTAKNVKKTLKNFC